MSDPQLPVDADAIDLDAVTVAPEQQPEPETWLVKASDPRWQVWREHNRRRPPSRAEKRGRVAAATAGTIIGVLAVGGVLGYAVQWQDLRNSAITELGSGSPYPLQFGDVAGDPSAKIGLESVVNGEAVVWSPNAARLAADKGFAAAVGRSDKSPESYSVTTDTWFSFSTACVYEINPVQRVNGKAAVVRLVDLTGQRDAMNRGYLAYGLIGLGIAGATGGAVWWGLGRQLNKKVEPEDV
jgi:hypothetical protein